jgi:hypothetical protein
VATNYLGVVMQIGDTVLTEECVGSKVTYVPSMLRMIQVSGKVEQYLLGMIYTCL